MGRGVLVVLVLGAGFAYGVLVGEKHVFPYRWIDAARRALTSESDPSDAPAPAVQPRMPTGWWVPVREERLGSALDALGYMDSYKMAPDEIGVIHHERDRTQPGHNLIVSAHEPAVLLADIEGEVLHEWTFDFANVPTPDDYEAPGVFGARCFRRARLLEDGELLALYERMALIKLDRDSNLMWSLVGFYHHDLDVDAEGTIHVLTHEIGVVPRIHPTRKTFEDFVVRVSPDGEILGQFSLLQALEKSPYASLLEKADPAREDVFHTNTIEVLDGSLRHVSPLFREGNLLVSLWGLDTIAIVDPKRERVVWALLGMWHRQHEPILLESGNMLVFDNMGHRDGESTWSKVVEIDPFTQEIVWSYEGSEANDFYSELCGSSSRLSNGNTLITESLSGRAFEVTPDGDEVWRWASPYRAGPNGEGVAVLMEVIRLEPGFPLGWLP